VPVGALFALPIVVVRVRVAARPLNVNQSVAIDLQAVRNEVVFDAGIHLHDVAALAADVQVLNFGQWVHTTGAFRDFKNVSAVLKRSEELRGVDSKLQLYTDAKVNERIVGERV